MPIRTKPELLQILIDRVRSAGVGGLTTAEDTRIFETDIIDTMFALASTAGVEFDDSAFVHKTGNLTENVDGIKTFASAKFSKAYVLPATLSGAIENGRIENDGSFLYYNANNIRYKLLTQTAADLRYSNIGHTHDNVTYVNPGFMIPADKQKLDGLTSVNSFGYISDDTGATWGALSTADTLYFKNTDTFIKVNTVKYGVKNTVLINFDNVLFDSVYAKLADVYTQTEAGFIFAPNEHTHVTGDIIGLSEYVQAQIVESRPTLDQVLQEGNSSALSMTIGNLTVQNLFVLGSTTTVNSQTVEVTDNLILINKGEPGAGVTARYAGIQVDRGTLIDYQFVWDESDGVFKIGESGFLQAVATRSLTMTDGQYGKWDGANYQFISAQIGYSELSGKPTSLSQFTNNLGNYGNWITKAQGDTYYYPLTGNPSNFLTTITGTPAGGELSGTYPNPTLVNSAVIGKVLTGYVSGSGTVSASDSILQAIQKLNGNISNLTTGVSSVFSRTGDVTAQSGDYNTSQVTESGNLYFTNARVNTQLNTYTGDVTFSNRVSAIGNLKVTGAMLAGGIANSKLSNSAITITAGAGLSGGGTVSLGGAITLTNTLTQYTDQLARLSISNIANGLTYINTTGVLSLTSGYVIPTTTDQANWNIAYANNHTHANKSFLDTIVSGATINLNIAGNAATATLAADSTRWNNYTFDIDTGYNVGFDYVLGRTTNTGQARLITQVGLQNWVGINQSTTFANNISGTAQYATYWGGFLANFNASTSSFDYIAVRDIGAGTMKLANSTNVGTFLGLGASAYEATTLQMAKNRGGIIHHTGTTDYGVQVVGQTTATNIFLAGHQGYSNGFTVQYNGSAMVYTFNNGNVTAPTFIGELTGNATTATLAANSTLWNGQYYDNASNNASLSTMMALNGATGKWTYYSKANVLAFLNVNDGSTLSNNIGGNSTTSTLAANSTNWAGYGFGGDYVSGTLVSMLAFNTTNGRWEATNKGQTQNWLNLGTAAYQNWDTAATANTIVRRDSNAYVHAVYFGAFANRSSLTGFAANLIGRSANTADPYYYDVTWQAVKDGLGLGTAAYQNWRLDETPNTLVKRDANGDIVSRYSFSTYVNTTDDVSSTLVYLIGKNGGDNYHRSYSATTVRSWLGMPSSGDTLQSVRNRGVTIYGTNTGDLSYNAAAFQVYSTNAITGNTAIEYAPRMAFHWGGVVASQVSMEASGTIAIRNNPGTGYESLTALVINSKGYFISDGVASDTKILFNRTGGNQYSFQHEPTQFYLYNSTTGSTPLLILNDNRIFTNSRLTVGENLIVAGATTFGTGGFVASVARAYTDGTHGLVLSAGTGIVNDLFIADRTGNAYLKGIAGTNSIVLSEAGGAVNTGGHLYVGGNTIGLNGATFGYNGGGNNYVYTGSPTGAFLILTSTGANEILKVYNSGDIDVYRNISIYATPTAASNHAARMIDLDIKANLSGGNSFSGTQVLSALRLTSGASNGYVLKSDASGNASWQSVASSYKGTWNANTNSPAVVDGAGTTGDYYEVSTGGTQLGRTFSTGGRAIYNGSIWEPVGVGASVTSVNGYTGVVVLVKSNIGLGNVDNTSDVNKPISTVQQIALDLKQNLLSGTGFVKLVAGTISYDNSTYLTTSAASSTYQTLANLSTLTTLGTSNTLYPSQLAVKTYVDSSVPSLTNYALKDGSNANAGSSWNINAATVTNGVYTTTFNSLGDARYYPLSSNPSGYLTSSSGSGLYQPLENQRLSTVNNVLFGAITSNISTGGYSLFQKSGSSFLFHGADQAAFGGTNNNDAVAFVYGANKYHIATNGSRRFTVNGDGTVTATNSITAPTFVGNLTGTASNSTLWAGVPYIGQSTLPTSLLAYNSTPGGWGYLTKNDSQNWLDVNNGVTLINSINGNASTASGRAFSTTVLSTGYVSSVSGFRLGLTGGITEYLMDKFGMKEYLNLNDGSTLTNNITGTSGGTTYWNGRQNSAGNVTAPYYFLASVDDSNYGYTTIPQMRVALGITGALGSLAYMNNGDTLSSSITGNSATTTRFAGYQGNYNETMTAVNTGGLMAFDNSVGYFRQLTLGVLKNWVGLGAAAYLDVAQGATGNTVVQRNSVGYIYGTYYSADANRASPSNSVLNLIGRSTNTADAFYYDVTWGAVQAGLGMPVGGDTFNSVSARGNTTNYDIGIGATASSGGANAKWLSFDGTGYGGGNIFKVGGVVQGYQYVDSSGFLNLQTTPASPGIRFQTNNGSQAPLTILSDRVQVANILEVGNFIVSQSNVIAGYGTDGGFENSIYQAGHNNIWRLRNAKEYGIGYYQNETGNGTDYIGFHFGNRNTRVFEVSTAGNTKVGGNLTVVGPSISLNGHLFGYYNVTSTQLFSGAVDWGVVNNAQTTYLLSVLNNGNTNIYGKLEVAGNMVINGQNLALYGKTFAYADTIDNYIYTGSNGGGLTILTWNGAAQLARFSDSGVFTAHYGVNTTNVLISGTPAANSNYAARMVDLSTAISGITSSYALKDGSNANAGSSWNITAANSNAIGGNPFVNGGYSGSIVFGIGYDSATSTFRPATASSFQSFLGLNVSAYEATTLQIARDRNANIVFSGTTNYGLLVTGHTGATNIFLAGQTGFSNGFTVKYNGTAMEYSFLDGNVTAPNFIGNLTGTASNSTLWNSFAYNHTPISSVDTYMMVYAGSGVYRSATKATVQTFLDVNNGVTLNNNITGNAATVTNGVYTTTFNGLGDTRYLRLTGGTLEEGGRIGFTRTGGPINVGGIGWSGSEFIIGGHPNYSPSAGNDVKFMGFGASVVLGTAGNNVLTINASQNSTFTGIVMATALIKTGGTSSQFLKADGSVDSNTYLTSVAAQTWASITGKPTTIAGYGITDFNSLGDARYSQVGHTHVWANITDRPTSLSQFMNNLGNYGGFLTSFTETDPTVPTYAKSLIAFSVIKSSTDTLYRAITYVPSWSEVTSKPAFATVATSGDYNDLSNRPTSYSLPTATASILGGVMVGSGLSISSGVLSVNNGSTAIKGSSSFNSDTGSGVANTFTIGTTMANTNYRVFVQIISSTSTTGSFVIPLAVSKTTTTFTVTIMSGSGTPTGILDWLILPSDWAGASGGGGGGSYTLPIATASVLGGFKVGSGLAIDAGTGVLSATGGGGSYAWGGIGGTLSSQTDLVSALAAKQDTLVSGTTIKTVNGISLLGGGNITISGGGGTIGFNPGDLVARITNGIAWDNGVNAKITSDPTSRIFEYNSGTTSFGGHEFKTSSNQLRFKIDTAGLISMPALASGSTTPTAAGTKHMLYIDANGLLGHEAIPSGGGGGSGTVNNGTINRLSYYASSGTAISELIAITANRVLLSDANGLPTASSVSNVTLGYLDATSSIQNQLSSKQATLVSATNIKTINGVTLLGSGDLTISTAAVWGSITGLLSNQGDLQTALNAKLNLTGGALTGALTSSSSITASGGFFDTSDINLKNVQDRIFDASKIVALVYKWKDDKDGKFHVGYSAQQVRQFMPDSVKMDSNGYLSINYAEVLVQKVSQLEARVKFLEEKYGVV